MAEDGISAEQRRQRWRLEMQALEGDILLKRLQRRTEGVKVLLATLAVLAALSQAAFNIFGERLSPTDQEAEQ